MRNDDFFTFKSRKWLLSFAAGESRDIPVYVCKYNSIKSTCSQLKTMGAGEWRCTKKGGKGGVFTNVTRIS